MVNKFVSKLEDVSTEYHLERVGHSGDPMFIPLRNDELLIIGRDICCSPHVSRKHASFEKSSEGNWFVKDLGSMNGVYRNKKPILPNCITSLQPGDSIGLGVPECEDNDEYLFILKRNNNLTQCVNNSSESAATAAEIIPVPNGIGQALGDLESQTKQDALARDSKRESSPEILELFSNNKTIKRESETPVTCLDSSSKSKNNNIKLNEGESSNNCVKVTSSSGTKAEKIASLPLKQNLPNDESDIEIIASRPLEQNLPNDESDIEIIGEAKILSNFKSKLELEVKKPPKKNNIISHYFKNKNPQLPLTDTNPEPQASCSTDKTDCVETSNVNLKKSPPGPLSKKKPIVAKELTKPISRPELGANSISLKITTNADIRNNTENAPKEERDIEPPTVNGKIHKPPRPSSISLQITSDPAIGNNIENSPMKEDCDVEFPFVNAKIHKPLEKIWSIKKLKKEALTKTCSVSLERLDTSRTKASSLKCKSSSSLPRTANSNKKYRKYDKNKYKNKNKRKGRVQVLQTSSESEEEFLPPLDSKQSEIDELDFEKMLSTTDDADRENMTYSQMDDVILLDEDDLQKNWPKPIKIEPTTDDLIIFEDYDNDLNFLPEDDVVENILRDDALQEDDDDVDKLRNNGANNLNFDPNDDAEPFFPELSQAFYEGGSDEDLAIPSTSEIKKQSKKNAPIQLIEPLALPPKWLKKSSHPELDTNRFYQKRKDKVSPPVPRAISKNKPKKKIDLKSKVQAEMGHRIPCPGGGSAIRPEPRTVPQLAKAVTNHAEPKRKLSGVKRKFSTDTNESPAPESAESVKKTKAKVTTTSRSDKMIAEEINSKFSKPLSGFKIPKKPPASKFLPQATTSTNTEVPSVEKPVLPNGYAPRPPKKFPPNTHKRINKPQDTVSAVQIPEVAQPTLLKSKIRFADIEDEFEHAKPIPSINGSAQVVQRPRINNVPKSNLKQSKQIPSRSAVTPSVSITPNHGYTVDKFIALVLKWNVKWLHEQELVSEPPPIFLIDKFYRMVATHYESINDHFKTYFPLIVLETWNMIFRDWKDKKHALKNLDSPSFVTTHLNEGTGSKFGEMVLECVVEKKNLFLLSHYKEGMLIIFDMRAKNKNKELKFTPTFGYIKELKCALFNVMTNQNAQLSAMPAARKPEAQHISLFVRIASRRGISPKWDKTMFVQPITYLRPTVRQVETLTNLHYSPLAKYILTPHTSAMTVSVFPQDRFEPVGTYNSSQKNAILGAGYAGLLPESTPKVVLLQGPPGTGKTHTCIGLIQQLLYGPSNQNSERRLLVLTPSNAAIDEITRRLIKLKPNIDANHPNAPPLNFIRVGQPDSIHSDIRGYSLDEIALTTSRESDRKTEEELNMQTNSLQARINSLDTVIMSKLSNKLDVVHEQAKIAQLHAEMKKVDGRKVKLNAVKSLQTKSFIASAKKKLITNASVILTTLTSCRQSIIDHVFGPSAKPLKFTACIVDEASQCCEPDLLLPLQYQITKLILIGDPKQLPATVLSQKAASFNFQKSLFERFYDYYQNRESPIVMLKEQYRMHSLICSFPSKYFYNDALYTSPCIDRQLTNFPLKPYVVLDLEDSKESNQRNASFENDNEATVIQNLCQEIIKIVPEHCSIGVITPYQGQRRLFIKNFTSNTLRRIEFNTVDGFQGREKDITILSCVRANNEQAIGFLKCPQRLNVAITRACKSLIICGHLDSLANHNHWRSLIEDAKSRKLIFKINSTDNISRILNFVTKK